MEPNSNDYPKKIRITWVHDFNQSDWTSPINQQEMEHFIHSMLLSTELDEMSKLDAMVTGDNHPDSLRMIMNSYTKHKNGEI